MSSDIKYFEDLLEQLDWLENNPRGIKAFTNKTSNLYQTVTSANTKFAGLPIEHWQTVSENTDKCLEVLKQLSTSSSSVKEIKKNLKEVSDFLYALIEQIKSIPSRDLPEPLRKGYSLLDLVRSHLYQLGKFSENLEAPRGTEQYYTTTIPKEELFPSTLAGSALYKLSLIFKQLANPTPSSEAKPEDIKKQTMQPGKAQEKNQQPTLTQEQKQQANLAFQQLLQEAKSQGIVEPIKVIEYIKNNAGKLTKTQHLDTQIRFAQSLNTSQQQYIMQLVNDPSEFAEAFNKTYQTTYTPAQIKQYTTPPTPSTSQAPSTTTPTQVPVGLSYKVEKGDTLSGIAKKHQEQIPGLTWQDIFAANSSGMGANLVNPDKIQVGQQLIIPTKPGRSKSPERSLKQKIQPKQTPPQPSSTSPSKETEQQRDSTKQSEPSTDTSPQAQEEEKDFSSSYRAQKHYVDDQKEALRIDVDYLTKDPKNPEVRERFNQRLKQYEQNQNKNDIQLYAIAIAKAPNEGLQSVNIENFLGSYVRNWLKPYISDYRTYYKEFQRDLSLLKGLSVDLDKKGLAKSRLDELIKSMTEFQKRVGAGKLENAYTKD